MLLRFVFLGCLVLAAIAGLATNNAASAADTIQDFDAIFPNSPPPLRFILTQSGVDPGASLSNQDDWSGQFLRLTQDVNSQQNHAAWNQVYAGSYEQLQIDMDFRVSVGNGGGADGLGVAYLNSSVFGSTTSSLTPTWTAEEPSLISSFGVGFDTWENGTDNGQNTVSLHWNNNVLLSESIDFDDDIFTFEDGIERKASIVVTPSGAGSQVTVSITEGSTTITPIDEFVNGLLPYDGRIAIGARTGGANANHDIDNVRLTVTPVGGTATQRMLEQFNDLPVPPNVDTPTLLGGTPYSVARYGTAPDPSLVQGNGPDLTDGFVRVAQQSGSQFNSIAFDKTADTMEDTVTAEFDFRIWDEADISGSADGFSFLLVPTDVYDDAGPIPTMGAAEDPVLAGAFGIGFDTYDNDEEGGVDPDNGCGAGGACVDRRANHVSLYWDGQMVGDFAWIDRDEFALVNDTWNHATVTLEQAEGGANVSLLVTDGTNGQLHTIFEDEFVEGLEFPEGAPSGLCCPHRWRSRPSRHRQRGRPVRRRGPAATRRR